MFEVKATTKGSWSALRSSKVREQIKDLTAFAQEGGLLPVVAIYWAQLDEFRLYSPERILEGIVRPGDADLEFPDPLSHQESVPSPETPSPSVGFPRPDVGRCVDVLLDRGICEDCETPPKPCKRVSREMKEAVDTV